MATITEVPEDSLADSKTSQDISTALNKSLAILHAAKNDNERFAALLLVTQLVKSNELDSASRKKLFDAVGFSFLNRLLNSKDVPEDCPADVFKSLGITILACFASDEELAVHPQMLSKITVFTNIVHNVPVALQDPTACNIIDDCYEILRRISSSHQGCHQLLNQGSIPKLCYIVANDLHGCKQALQVLLQVLSLYSEECWSTYGKDLRSMLPVISKKFKDIQDLEKFELCEILVALLSSASCDQFLDSFSSRNNQLQWELDVYHALRDILQSKVGPKQRDPALELSSILVNTLGMEWALGPQDETGKTDTKFLTIIINLASIEVKMTLEYCDVEALRTKQSLLSCCYTILENAIAFLILSSSAIEVNSASVQPLEESLSAKLYSIMIEAFKTVVKYLLDVSGRGKDIGADDAERAILFASMRMLCAWLAEDPEQVQDDLMKLLPFMLNVVRGSIPHLKDQKETSKKSVSFDGASSTISDMTAEVENLEINNPKVQPDLVRFLLPPLCHLTADDKLRDILIKNDLMSLLEGYLIHIWDSWTEIEASKVVSLQTLCSVLLNLTVLEKELVKTNQNFRNILEFLSKALANASKNTKHVVLVANFVTLSLMIIHHQQDDAFSAVIFKNAVWFLSESKWVKSTPESEFAQACQERWEDLSELWLLSMQVITECLISHAALLPVVAESGWAGEIASCLGTMGKSSSDRDECQLALQNLLSSLEKVKQKSSK